MKVVTYSRGEESPRAGLLVDDQIVDLSAQSPSVLALIEGGAAALEEAKKQASSTAKLSLADVTLHAPLLTPPRIFCIGLNYRDHAIESKMELPKTPVIFFKLISALIGNGASIALPKMSTQPDYEAELAVVIGKGGYRIARDRWEDHVFGYTILNDVSARDIQLSTSQWTMGKSFNTFAPSGPAIVTKDEVGDPHVLGVKLSIDGEVLQNSNTRELIFNIPDLIAYISSIAPLMPGDIISTGTPAGVGLGRTPQRWLRAGETVTVEIDKLGKLVNPVVEGD